MRFTRCQTLMAAIVAAAISMSFAQSAHADWVDDFDGGFDQFWQFGSDGGNATTFPGGQIINDQLVLTSTETPDDGGVPTAFGVVLAESFTDVRMTGNFNPNGDENINDTMGLLFRGNTVNQTFYMAELNYSESSLIIYRNNPGVTGGNSNLATAPINNLLFTDSVYVEVEAIGNRIEAWAYEDATKANQLANTSFVDDTEAALTSGLSGVLANENFGGLPLLAVFDDVTASVISSTAAEDLNGDGFVDGLDLGILLGNWDTNVDPSGGELNDTQPVDGLDLGILLGAWNPPPSLAASSVPEPSACVLLLGAVLLTSATNRRRV